MCIYYCCEDGDDDDDDYDGNKINNILGGCGSACGVISSNKHYFRLRFVFILSLFHNYTHLFLLYVFKGFSYVNGH